MLLYTQMFVRKFQIHKDGLILSLSHLTNIFDMIPEFWYRYIAFISQTFLTILKSFVFYRNYFKEMIVMLIWILGNATLTKARELKKNIMGKLVVCSMTQTDEQVCISFICEYPQS